MIVELDALRTRFGRFLVWLFWAHVPVLALAAWLNGQAPSSAAAAGAIVAIVYQLAWWRYGIAPATRYLSAVALMAEPAVLLFLLKGHPWQMDMHMYFFAMLALTIAWCDRRAILVAATVVAVHHLLLLHLLPFAVFPGEGNLGRVLFHAAIVSFQTAALIWLSNMLVGSFVRIDGMRQEIIVKNKALEERTREAENASEAKSLFLANMSHEIRTPMNAILGFCHLVGRTALDDKQRDYISKINGSAVALLRLINDILDFSKNEAGKLTLELRPFDLRRMVEGQIQLVSGDAQARGVRVTASIDPALPSALLGDEMRIGQVLLNLLSNAVKFSHNDEVKISVGVEAVEAAGVTIALSVRDNGIGIPIEDQARLFSSFTQADSSTTRRFGGTGLGLAICRQIVEQMGGSIGVESTIGGGSVFTCLFTLAPAETHISAATGQAPDHIRGLRVLAADDNPAARQIVEEIFAGWGMSIDLVASGGEAIAACRGAASSGQPYDLVMLDWKMPGMDGMETIRALHDIPELGPLPVTLIITAYGTEELSGRAGQAGISAFLSKPMDPAALLAAITNLFPATGIGMAGGHESPEATVALAAPLRGARVLLVEDNEINREIAIELLTDAGLVVDCAENGRIACTRVAADGHAYAAVLMDLQMPEMDGIEATRIIRQTWSHEALPIIAMTAHAFEEERQRCFDVGMDDHVAKPIDPPLLIATLNRRLRPVEGRQTPVAAGGAAASAAMLPVHLPPFDIPAALRRVNGKEVLLRKLILDFARTYENITNELRVQIATGLLADARRLAHTLKGVAGSLELGDLQAKAQTVEMLLAAGSAQPALDTLAALQAALEPAVQAARTLDVQNAGAADPAVTLVGESLTAKLARATLRDLVMRRSLGARGAFEALADALDLAPAQRAAHPLHEALQRLDYDTALALIDAPVPVETAA
ncbi:response regulator [Hephaestia sp. GCM10023244]|uniref:hybrid sensor histidine kinase/response regulator n=1 Tax=unclassified Hephaestia TaxID=2631281 RepID=UPI00207774B6|nr:hybrid sensor histidine kinase/response regulator [Hephaestia sp. MAHUQ-44]MCM8729368.1 response regulator [Hephaestia sp. MAHUQ-44]